MSATNSQKSNPLDAPSKASDDDLSLDEESYEDDAFEQDSQGGFEELSLDTLERMKQMRQAATFPNRTFTPAQIREIERENAILMGKILTYSRKPSRPKSTPNKYYVTSSAINRRRTQKKIDWENQILLKKIQAVKPVVKY